MEPAGSGQDLPTEFALYPVRPNPFTKRTAIRFALPVGAATRLEVFDVQGRRVQTLQDGWLPPGYHVTEWDGHEAGGLQVGAGTYFCRLRAGSFQQQRKLSLAR
jgi:hypothetical protein